MQHNMTYLISKDEEVEFKHEVSFIGTVGKKMPTLFSVLFSSGWVEDDKGIDITKILLGNS